MNKKYTLSLYFVRKLHFLLQQLITKPQTLSMLRQNIWGIPIFNNNQDLEPKRNDE